MDETSYKYDIAFSLLSQDEGLAVEINDLLCDRYRTFLYSKRQQEIAGTDGELKFKTVFAKEARLVIVLYRKGWGSTPWTRMEEDAIRGRAYEEGYDFVKFVPLDVAQAVPNYLPKVHLWINALRLGAKGAAGAIEARLQESGAIARKETAVGRAARLHRAIEFQKKRESYGNSHEAITDANESLIAIADCLKTKIAEIKEAGILLRIEVKQDQYSIVVMGLKNSLRIYWHYNYANTLEGAHLDVELWNGHPPMRGLQFWDEPSKLHHHRFKFDWLASAIGGWIRNDDEDAVYDATALADFALHYYMDNGN